MSVITDTTHQAAPIPPSTRRRLLWAALAFAVGAVSGGGITVAVDDDTRGGADVFTTVSDAERHGTAIHSGSADAVERAAQHRQLAEAADCTRQPTSADAVERCLTAGG